MSKICSDQILICPSNSKKGTAKKETKPKSRSDQQFYTVERILDKIGKGALAKFLVKWEGYTEGESTWEPVSNLKNCRVLIKEFYARRSKGSEAETLNIKPVIKEKNTSSSNAKNLVSHIKPLTSGVKPATPNIIDLLTRSKKPESINVSISKQTSDKQATISVDEQNPQRKKDHKDKADILEIDTCRKKANLATELSVTKKLKPLSSKSRPKSSKGLIDKKDAETDEQTEAQPLDIVDVVDALNYGGKQQTRGTDIIKKVATTSLSKPLLVVNLQETSKAKENTEDLIERANRIAEHAFHDGALYFRLDWDDSINAEELRPKFFKYEVVDQFKPRLLTAYLKNFIKLSDN